jgi:hypothetical protein
MENPENLAPKAKCSASAPRVWFQKNSHRTHTLSYTQLTTKSTFYFTNFYCFTCFFAVLGAWRTKQQSPVGGVRRVGVCVGGGGQEEV